MEAMTSEASESGRSDVVTPNVPEVTDAAPAEANETAAAETQPEGRAQNEAPDGDGETTNVVEQKPVTVESLQQELADFKRQYTRKTQESSESSKLLAMERDDYKSQVDQLTNVVKSILEDQNTANTYRQQMGIGSNKIEVPELKTNEQLQEFLGNALTQIQENAVKIAEQRALQSSASKVDEVSRQNRWLNAQATLKTNPLFEENLDYLNHLVETKYSKEYRGDNELEVYQKALGDLESRFGKFKELGKQETLESLKKKSTAATNVPRKTITSTPNQKAGQKRSVEEIIAAVNNRIPAA